MVFSIDPSSCKDIDDALHCEKLDNGNFEIGVHIADVSHYVKPNTNIDREAQQRGKIWKICNIPKIIFAQNFADLQTFELINKSGTKAPGQNCHFDVNSIKFSSRSLSCFESSLLTLGTSIYLPDRRIDMLPEELSTDVCSLIQDKDRFTLSVLWEFTTNAEIVNTQYSKSIINNKFKFSYEQAWNVISDDLKIEEYEAVNKDFDTLTFAGTPCENKFVGDDCGHSVAVGEIEDSSIYAEPLRNLLDISKKLKEKRKQNGSVNFDSGELNFELDENLQPVGMKQ